MVIIIFTATASFAAGFAAGYLAGKRGAPQA